MKRFGTVAAVTVVTGWYVFVYLVARPLTDGPVLDSWIYQHAVSTLELTGEIRFAGITHAMPVSQVLYGAAWGALFGDSFLSLDLSVAVLGALGAILFYALACRCGASEAQALLATGLLICNPCYLFVSFSFMSEVPFLSLLVGAHLAFARSEEGNESLWLWLSALLIVMAFLVRPFAAAAIVGCALAIVDREPGFPRLTRPRLAPLTRKLAPFGTAFAMCALAWTWLTVLNPAPWMLKESETSFVYLFDIPLGTYLRGGLLEPALYLGIVLSPVAALQVFTSRWRLALAIGAGLFALTLFLVWLDPRIMWGSQGPPPTPDLDCSGNWRNALLLRGLPLRFFWDGNDQWLAAALGSFGAAGLALAALNVTREMSRGALAVIVAAGVYLLSMFPLWLFRNRYDLVLVPAGCLICALCPLQIGRLRWAGALAMLAVLGWVSVAGVYDYQRGLQAVIEARNALLRSGVPRSSIDAGWSLDGNDLYRYPTAGAETKALEEGIPSVTSWVDLADYTIASAPISGTRVIRRLRWPGPFGIGARELYVLKKDAS